MIIGDQRVRRLDARQRDLVAAWHRRHLARATRRGFSDRPRSEVQGNQESAIRLRKANRRLGGPGVALRFRLFAGAVATRRRAGADGGSADRDRILLRRSGRHRDTPLTSANCTTSNGRCTTRPGKTSAVPLSDRTTLGGLTQFPGRIRGPARFGLPAHRAWLCCATMPALLAGDVDPLTLAPAVYAESRRVSA